VITPARIYAACIGIFGIQMACQQTFTAIGDAKSSLAAAIMRKFVLLIPLIYIVPLIMERQSGIWCLFGRTHRRLPCCQFHQRLSSISASKRLCKKWMSPTIKMFKKNNRIFSNGL
jgi:hypothetical protein